jgi:hypothetical protein
VPYTATGAHSDRVRVKGYGQVDSRTDLPESVVIEQHGPFAATSDRDAYGDHRGQHGASLKGERSTSG